LIRLTRVIVRLCGRAELNVRMSLHKYLPDAMGVAKVDGLRSTVAAAAKALRLKTSSEAGFEAARCKLEYLRRCTALPLYGATFFAVEHEGQDRTLALNMAGVFLLHASVGKPNLCHQLADRARSVAQPI
jgi:hypothetical protein